MRKTLLAGICGMAAASAVAGGPRIVNIINFARAVEPRIADPGIEETLYKTTETQAALLKKYNLKGTFLCDRAVLQYMMAQRSGQILNIASTSGLKGVAFDSVYCASKFGLLGLSESLLQELHPFGIRVRCVMPGRVATDFAGEPPQDWHLSAEDVAQAVIDTLSFAPRALASRIELRPARPPSPAPR